MRVLHVMWSLEFGGIERLVLDLCRAQRKTGLAPGVLAGQAKGRMAGRFAVADVPVFDACLRNGFSAAWANSGEIENVMRDANIIHFHSYTPAVARSARRSDTPIVFTDHGNYGLGRNRTWRDRVKFKLQARFLGRHVRFMTFNSQFTRGLAHNHFSLNQVPNRIIYNGIDFDRYENVAALPAADLNIDKHRLFIVGTTSRFAGFKRIDRLIRAFASMDVPDTCHLLLVGDGPLRGDYEKLVQQLGVDERTSFTGFQPNVEGYQALMDVCVFPSAGEPFGLVAVETLALGKPTLVTQDGGGITEIVKPLEPENVVDGVTGLTHRLNEYHTLWRKGVFDDPGRVTARRQRAREFDIGHMAKEFDAVYETCLLSGALSQKA